MAELKQIPLPNIPIDLQLVKSQREFIRNEISNLTIRLEKANAGAHKNGKAIAETIQTHSFLELIKIISNSNKGDIMQLFISQTCFYQAKALAMVKKIYFNHALVMAINYLAITTKMVGNGELTYVLDIAQQHETFKRLKASLPTEIKIPQTRSNYTCAEVTLTNLIDMIDNVKKMCQATKLLYPNFHRLNHEQKWAAVEEITSIIFCAHPIAGIDD